MGCALTVSEEMEWPAMGDTVDVDYFDAIYSRSDDPWRYGADPYELDKYRKQIDWLTDGGRLRFRSGLEVACAIGVFTRMLAGVCDRVHGFDISPRAVELARRNLADVGNVALEAASFPDRASHPPERYDAVAIPEVLYYFDLETLLAARRWIEDALRGGARVVVTDYCPPDRVGFGGEIVHDILTKELRPWHVRGERWPLTGFDEQGRAYRMDLFAPSAEQAGLETAAAQGADEGGDQPRGLLGRLARRARTDRIVHEHD